MHISRMTQHDIHLMHPDSIPEMEAKLASCGVSVSEMCRQADVAETTWGRWKRREVSPTFRRWDSVVDTFKRLTAAPTDTGASQ